MPWVYNYEADDLAGWLWQEGEWHWGAVLTWHVVDLEPDWNAHDFAWVCNLWLWDYADGYSTWNIYKLKTEHIAVRSCDVAWNPWMEHPVGRHWWLHMLHRH
jgi:hypothetical protein